MNVIIGVGVRVRVVKEDTVMPRKTRFEPVFEEYMDEEVAGGPPVSEELRSLSEAVQLVVATTTECGILRIISRRWVDNLGSSSSLRTCWRGPWVLKVRLCEVHWVNWPPEDLLVHTQYMNSYILSRDISKARN